jgi:hypothetical protein
MTAPEMAGLILARAKGAEYAAFASGVDQVRVQAAREYVERFQDKAAMTALWNEHDAIILHSTYDVACAHLAARMPTVAPARDDEPTDPVITMPADRGAK